MSLERIRTWFWSLSKLDTLLALSIVTVVALLFFRIPLITHYQGVYFNDSFQYLLITLFALTCDTHTHLQFWKIAKGSHSPKLPSDFAEQVISFLLKQSK